MMLHLHNLPMIKSLYTFYSLLIFQKNLWTLIIGNPLYLSNWWMRYSRMTWHLLVLAKYLGFILQIKTQNSMFLEWHSNTYQGHIWSCMTKKPSIYASYFVLSSVKFCDPCWGMFHAPKIKTHVHATNK